MELLIKEYKAKEDFADNHGHNILRLLDILANFSLTTSETKSDYL